MVPLLHQRHKVELVAVGCGRQPQARIGLARCHRVGYRRVGGLGVVIPADGCGGDSRLRQQLVQQHPGARAQGPVHKAGALACDVGQRGQPQRVAACHDQPLAAPGETDDLVLPRLEQRLVGALGQ